MDVYFNNIRRLLSESRKAVEHYKMIADGDRIAVGISGGKDSLSLLCILYSLREFLPYSFDLVALTADMGFPGSDYSPIAEFCEKMGIPFECVHTQLGEIIFDVRKEKNPCSLCSRMRRGILHEAVQKLGCNKLALGHHFDDVVDTFMLNLFYEGRLGSFSPVTYLSRRGITLIRPMVYVPEKDIRYFVSKNDLPIQTSLCPADKNTERESMKKLLAELEKNNKGLRPRIFLALEKAGIDGYSLSEDRSEPDDK